MPRSSFNCEERTQRTTERLDENDDDDEKSSIIQASVRREVAGVLHVACILK